MANTCFPIRVVISAYLIVSLCLFFPHLSTAFYTGEDKQEGGSVALPLPGKHGTVVTKDQRWRVVSSEFGEISTVKVADGRDGFYHLQFITMEPNSLFLPAHLHSDMVFYVNSGSGTLSWVEREKDSYKLHQVDLRTGDVYRLRTGSFFYLQSNLESERRKLRVYAIFSNTKEIREGSSFGAYSSVGDLVLGFDNKVLQAAFNADEEVIQELRSGERKPMIVHGVSKVEEMLTVHYRIMREFLGSMENGMIDVSKTKNKSKKDKAYNILEAKHDVENCNGWSLVVTRKQLDALKDSDFGVFMVNLTKGAIMGPHWNPLTAEIAVVLSGRGMVHVVCPSSVDETECKNSRFRVEEGDVFVVPRYHPMAQISFNNESFVFMGFTTTQKKNHPQYLVGSASVFQVLDKRVLATSLGVSNTTMDEVLSAQREAIILECTSCAEEEERLLEEEIQRQKEEEARKREEEERKKEEARREQEESQKREEEEAAREQEAKRRQEEEEARRQEEEERREQEEAQKREEEEAARQREEEEVKRRQEEEAAKHRQQEEEDARQEEEAARQGEEARTREEEVARQEEEAAARRRQQEEEDARQQEEEARRRQKEAERQQREQQEEAARRRQEEEEGAKQQEDARRRKEQEAARQQRRREEEAARRQQEEEARRRYEEEGRTQQEKKEEVARQFEEDARRPQEAAARKEMEQKEEAGRRQQREQARRQQEEAARQQQESRSQQEKEAARRQQHEEETRRQHEEKAASRRGGSGGGGGKEHKGQGEGEAASKSEEAMVHRQEEAEAATRGSEAGGQGGGITSR